MASATVKTKKAIVIVLDVGKSMHYECKQSSATLIEAKKCAMKILQQKIFSESKDEIAIVLCGTLETSNALASLSATEYNHIVVACKFQPVTWDLLQLVDDIEESETSADFIDALVVAMDMLHRQTNGRNTLCQRIVLISNFDSPFSCDQLNTICDNLKNSQMELTVVGPSTLSCDDSADASFTTNKTSLQVKAEVVLKKLLKTTNGDFYSFEEVSNSISYRKKTVASATWNVNLDIFENCSIPISAYTKIETKSKPWKTAAVNSLTSEVIKQSTYHLNDEAETAVPKDEIIQAYKYGTTLVPFSKEDKANMEYQSGERGMKVLYFTKEENIERRYCIGDKTIYVFGRKNDESAGIKLASFIQALYETKTVAVVRYVSVTGSTPKIGFLSPRIKLKYECLVYITLPFREDLRHFVFAPLDSNSSNLPSEEQCSAIDDLITKMDLSTAAIDEDGNNGEALKSKSIVDPYFQRICQCFQHRVLHPDKPLPEISNYIRSIIEPFPEMVDNAAIALKNIKQLFPLQDGAKRKLSNSKLHLFSNGKDENISIKKLCVNNENYDGVVQVTDDKVHEVGTVNPVKDFNSLINDCQEEKWFIEVCKQLEKIIMVLFNDSMISKQEDKILSCLSSFRNASIERKQPFLFNDFIRSFKETLMSRRKNLWTKVVEKKLCLITSDECLLSTISLKEASGFSSNLAEESLEEIDEDERDLLEEL